MSRDQHPAQLSVKTQTLYEATITQPGPIGLTQPTATSDLLYTPPYLLPWGFLSGCSIFVGIFHQGLCHLLSSAYYITLPFSVPLAVPYLVAPEFSGLVAALFSLVAYAARASWYLVYLWHVNLWNLNFFKFFFRFSSFWLDESREAIEVDQRMSRRGACATSFCSLGRCHGYHADFWLSSNRSGETHGCPHI